MSTQEDDTSESGDEKDMPFSSEKEADDTSSGNIFDDITEDKVFRSRNVLRESYYPEEKTEIFHRDEQISTLASRFENHYVKHHVLEGTDPTDATLPHTILSGPHGTGKTLIARFITDQIQEKVGEDQLATFHINCANCKTENQVIINIGNQFYPPSKQKNSPNGYKKQDLLNWLFNGIEKVEQDDVILLLDDVGRVYSLNDILYEVSRSSTPGTQLETTDVGVIITSNTNTFIENMRGQVESSFKTATPNIQFSEYTNPELKTICENRAQKSFVENGITDTATSLAAALASQSGGDARYALQVLLRAGELAENNSSQVVEGHVRKAVGEIERDRIRHVISKEKRREQVLIAVLSAFEITSGTSPKGIDLVEKHNRFCRDANEKYGGELFSQYPQKKAYSYLQDFETQSIINIVSKRGHNEYELVYDAVRYLEVVPSEIIEYILVDEEVEPSEIDDETGLIHPDWLDEPNQLNY